MTDMSISPLIIAGIALIIVFGCGLGYFAMLAYYHYQEETDLDWVTEGRIASRGTLILLNFVCFILVASGFSLIALSASV